MSQNNPVRDNAYQATCLRFDIAKALEQNKGTVEVTIAHLRAILDERDALLKDRERQAWRYDSLAGELLSANQELDALRERLKAVDLIEATKMALKIQELRERLEAAERIWKSAEDATWAFAALGGAKREEYVEELRHACREYRERFGGRDA